MTPQYKPLKMNKLNEYKKGDNNALLTWRRKPNAQKPTHAATSAMQPLSEFIYYFHLNQPTYEP